MVVTFRQCQCPKWLINQYGKKKKKKKGRKRVIHIRSCLSTFFLSSKPIHRLYEISILGKKTFCVFIFLDDIISRLLSSRESWAVQSRQFIKASSKLMWRYCLVSVCLHYKQIVLLSWFQKTKLSHSNVVSIHILGFLYHDLPPSLTMLD